jgi:hypothetical protein
MGIEIRNYIISFVMPMFFSLLLMSFISESVLAQKKMPVTTKTEGGLNTVIFETQEGKVEVNLPDDLAAGDTFSGTVIAEPSGNTVEEREDNADVLNGYVVELKAKEKQFGEIKVDEGKLRRIAVPASLAGGKAKLVLINSKGEKVGITDITVQDTPPAIEYTTPPSSLDFKLPSIGQPGKPVEINGPFDGNFDTTTIKIGGRDSKVLAESPRKVVVLSPRDVVGSTKIEVIEKGVVSQGDFNNIDIARATPKRSLDGLWRSKSGMSSWSISQDGQSISAVSVRVATQDMVRGYKPNDQMIRGTLQGNLLVGKIKQFFQVPLEECMAMCPSKCEQWAELMLILSEDGNTLQGQFQEKVINTESCIVIEFGWRPYTMLRVVDAK